MTTQILIATTILIFLTACAASTPIVTPTPSAFPTRVPNPSAQPTAGPNPSALPSAVSSPTATKTAPNPVPGWLEGRVTVGPLRPVERVDVTPPPIPPEVFTARSINIFQADGTTLVTNVRFSGDGTYRISLPPGFYVVALARTGMDRASELPKRVTIESSKTLRLDVDIDTGMR